jgi:hypothetical protein
MNLTLRVEGDLMTEVGALFILGTLPPGEAAERFILAGNHKYAALALLRYTKSLEIRVKDLEATVAGADLRQRMQAVGRHPFLTFVDIHEHLRRWQPEISDIDCLFEGEPLPDITVVTSLPVTAGNQRVLRDWLLLEQRLVFEVRVP